jgi:hypothetical protein
LSSDWKAHVFKKAIYSVGGYVREQAALARNEMEYSLMKYWLAEAEEWKQLRHLTHSRKELRIAHVS